MSCYDDTNKCFKFQDNNKNKQLTIRILYVNAKMLRIRKGKKDEIDDEKFSTSFEKESDEGKFDSSSEADESFSIDAPGKARSPSPIITQQPLPLYPRPSTSKQYGADPLYPRPALPSTSKQYGADRTQKVIVPLPTESGNKILKVSFC